MIKKTITYTDYNDVERTEDKFFNLSEAELLEMNLKTTDDISDDIKIFKDFILKAYGEKTIDGKYFRKEDDNGRPLYINFKQSPAYSKLFMELATNPDAFVEFVNGVIPSDMAKKANIKALISEN